jgi:hypothetical protein
MATPKDPEKGFIDLTEEFFKDLAKDKNPEIMTCVNNYAKIIMNLTNEALEAAWPELMLQKITTFKEASPEQGAVIALVEVVLKRRMFIVSSKISFAFGEVKWRLRYQVTTGDYEYFNGDGMIDLDAILAQYFTPQGNTRGGSTPAQPQRLPVAPQFNLQALEDMIGEKFVSLRSHLQNALKTATLSGAQQAVLWSGWFMKVGICVMLVMVFLKIKHLPDSVHYVKELVLDVKKKGEDNEKAVNKITDKLNSNFSSIRDSLGKLMPKPKFQPAAKAKVKAKRRK